MRLQYSILLQHTSHAPGGAKVSSQQPVDYWMTRSTSSAIARRTWTLQIMTNQTLLLSLDGSIVKDSRCFIVIYA